MKNFVFNSGDLSRRVTTGSSLITILLVFLGECCSHYFLCKTNRSSPSTEAGLKALLIPVCALSPLLTHWLTLNQSPRSEHYLLWES